MINLTYKRLEVKNGRQLKTTSFLVSYDASSKDIFYDESIWPEGCRLRDWIFYGKNKADDTTDTRNYDNHKSDTHSDYGDKSSD